jgi:hypothetical protein
MPMEWMILTTRENRETSFAKTLVLEILINCSLEIPLMERMNQLYRLYDKHIGGIK